MHPLCMSQVLLSFQSDRVWGETQTKLSQDISVCLGSQYYCHAIVHKTHLLGFLLDYILETIAISLCRVTRTARHVEGRVKH
jgi:hypothetical protein